MCTFTWRYHCIWSYCRSRQAAIAYKTMAREDATGVALWDFTGTVNTTTKLATRVFAMLFTVHMGSLTESQQCSHVPALYGFYYASTEQNMTPLTTTMLTGLTAITGDSMIAG